MKLIKSKNNHKYHVLVCYLVIFALEVYFFRKVIFSNRLIGDINDARLNNLIVEHWYRSFLGEEKLSIVNIFYPMQGTLAFTDMLMGFAIPYIGLRILGIEMFLANKIVLILVHFIGSFSLFELLRNKFRVQCNCALLGVVAFSFSSAYYVRIGHTQLMAISFVPLIIYTLYLFFENIEDRKRSFIFGILTVSQYVILMYTSWYTAFFSALFVLTFSVIYVCLFFCHNREELLRVFGFIRKRLFDYLIIFLYMLVLAVPFFKMYLPISKMFGKRSYEEITKQLPELVDFINVSTGNKMFGWLIERWKLNERDAFVWELHVGFSVVVLLLFFIILWSFRRQYNEHKYRENVAVDKTYNIICRNYALSFAVMISFILLVQSCGVSLWWLVYKLVPGASAIRAVVRYNYFLNLPIAISLAIGCNQYITKKGVICRFVLPIVLCGLIWFSNDNKYGISANWNIDQEYDQLNSVPIPPDDCKVMYIVDSMPQEHSYMGQEYSWVSYQHFAWEICYKYGLKNLNGYSGQQPIGWNFGNAADPNIHEYASDWLMNTCGSDNVYYYDMGTGEWYRHE